MKNLISKYRKAFSVFSLSVYLLITANSFFHSHQIDFHLEKSLTEENKYFNSGYHQNGICQLMQFGSTQLNDNTDSNSYFITPEIPLRHFTFQSFISSSEDNLFLRRAPPSLS
jgi:hypothetical protein